MARSVLVTGGSGYFGTCSRRAHSRTVTTCASSTSTRPGRTACGRVCCRRRPRPPHVRAACDGVDVVFHTVAQVPLAKDRALFDSVNVAGTGDVARRRPTCARRARSCTCRRAPCSGSPNTTRSTRPRPCRPLEAYGAAKLQAELLCHDAIAAGLDVTIIRPRTILGHGRLGIIALLFEFVADGAPVFVFDGGHNRYQFVHADDLADACLRAGDRAGPCGLQHRRDRVRHDARDVASARRPRARPARACVPCPARRPASSCGRSPALGLAPFAPYHWLLYGESLYFDIKRARAELGWEPQHSNASMVIESYEWFLAHRERSRGWRRSARTTSRPCRPGLVRVVEVAAVTADCAGRTVAPSRSPVAHCVALLLAPLSARVPAARRALHAHPHWYPLLDMGADRDPRPRHRGRTSAADRPRRTHRAVRPRRRQPPRTDQLLPALAGLEAVRRVVVRNVRRHRRARHRQRSGSRCGSRYRRGGAVLRCRGRVVIAVVMRAFGAFMLTLPWNPYLPVLWWFVVLLAVWSVLVRRPRDAARRGVRGTFCVQTHISYLGLVGGLGVLAIVVVAFRRWRSRADHARIVSCSGTGSRQLQSSPCSGSHPCSTNSCTSPATSPRFAITSPIRPSHQSVCGRASTSCSRS